MSVGAQTGADGGDMFGRRREPPPRHMLEMMSKMQVEQAKREHQELLDRGQELVAIATQLEKAVETKGGFSDSDLAKLEHAEKLVKKIRGDLGGDDDEEAGAEVVRSTAAVEVIKSLRQRAVALVDELKKTSRFTISVVAIQSSNTVLRLVRFLKSNP
jgi:hypothetical protein